MAMAMALSHEFDGALGGVNFGGRKAATQGNAASWASEIYAGSRIEYQIHV